MSSSLDDLEPYEIFQQELDEYLNQYEKILAPHIDKKDLRGRLLTLHHLIEFLCFEKMKNGFQDILPEEIKQEFPNYLKENFFSAIPFQDLKMIIGTYLDFIKSQNKSIPEDLLERLKF
jgi:hypothetical protein